MKKKQQRYFAKEGETGLFNWGPFENLCAEQNRDLRQVTGRKKHKGPEHCFMI